MAQSNDETDSWSTSLTGWWQSAKEKSTTALEFMKRDLTEFSQVLQHDAANAVSSTAAVLKDKLKVDSEESVAGRAKKGLTTLVHSVSGAFYPMRENDENEVVLIKNSQPVVLDKWQAELHKIKTENSTFCHEPEGPPELYESWLETFCIEEHGEEISNIMVDYPETRQIFTKLVPMAISNIEFWQRYFYRVHQLKLSELRRAELVSRVEDTYEELAWEEDEDASKQNRGEPIVGPSTKNSNLDKPVVPIIANLATDLPLKEPIETEPIQLREIKNVESFQSENEIPSASAEITSTIEAKSESLVNVQHSDEESGNIVKLELNERAPPSSTDSSDKEGTTGDEWEKDFELEIKDLKEKEAMKEKIPKEEDWENWE